MQNYEVKGEKLLLWAMVENAIADAYGVGIYGYPSRVEKYRRAAFSWFYADDTEPFSFMWITEQLDLEPEQILKYIPHPSEPVEEIRKKYLLELSRTPRESIQEMFDSFRGDTDPSVGYTYHCHV